jgi:DNA-directed RNA polymerase specialized sigma24 family protein
VHPSLSPSDLARSARDVDAQARRGVEAAWHDLFAYYYPRVFRLLASRLGEVEAEPLARATFLEAHERSTGAHGSSNGATATGAGAALDPTVGHIILRAARDALRQRMAGAGGELPHELGFVAAEYMEPEVRDSLAGLPPDDRVALELRYVVGLTTSEAAAVLAMRPAALARLVHRAAGLIRDAAST